MTKEELARRTLAHRRWERSITLPILIPLMVVWLGGSWLIMQDMVLGDRSVNTKDQVLLALLLMTLLVEAAVVWLTWRKSAFRAHDLLCPRCDGRILSIWNRRRVLETGRCQHCGYALIDATS